jgi:hypothetical protein
MPSTLDISYHHSASFDIGYTNATNQRQILWVDGVVFSCEENYVVFSKGYI